MNLTTAIEICASKHASEKAKMRGLKNPFEKFDLRDEWIAKKELEKNNITIDNMKIYQGDKIIATIEFIWSNLIAKSGYRLPKNFKIIYE